MQVIYWGEGFWLSSETYSCLFNVSVRILMRRKCSEEEATWIVGAAEREDIF